MTERFRHDLCTAVRSFAADRGILAAAVLTLAIGVGLNLAMFGLIDRAILSPAAHVADPAHVFTLGFEPVDAAETDPARPRMTTTSYVAFAAIRDHVPGDAAAWQRLTTGAIVGGSQINVDALLVSGWYFTLLGAGPRVGRFLDAEDDAAPNGAPVAVVSHAFWTRVFGGDSKALGQRIAVRGVELTVVGVMPAGFSGHSSINVDVWIPFHAVMQQPGWDQNQFINVASVLVRVPREATPASIAAQAGVVSDRRVTLLPIRGTGIGATERRITYWLSAVSLLVLTIGLANTGTLLLVRGAARRRDLAIRADAWRHSRAAANASAARSRAARRDRNRRGAVFVLLARRGAAAPFAARRERERRADAAHPVCGRPFRSARLCRRRPGWDRTDAAAHANRGDRLPATARACRAPGVSNDGLRDPARGRGPVRTQLVYAGCAGFRHADRGRAAGGIRWGGSGRDQDALFAGALDRIRRLPGVQLATPIKTIPFTGFNVPPIGVPGLPAPPNVNGQLPFLTAATPEFFDILDVRILEGRRFVEADDRGAPVVIVNQTMARALWPGQSALGKCIRIGFEPSFDPFTASGPPPLPTTVPCREVIGVARDVRQRSVVPTGAESRLMQYFVPFSQVPPPPTGVNPGSRVEIYGLLLRAGVGPDQLGPAIRRLVVGERTDLPFLQVRRYAELLERQIRPWRLGTALLSLFGALALIVASVGLYAAFAHAVSERRRELAIRIAVGARPLGVLTMILREAAFVAAGGVLCGSAVVMFGGRSLQSMLFGTAPTDPAVLVGVGLLMVIVATLATLLPALSASRSDPSVLLRAE